jgi:hypothetical protein
MQNQEDDNWISLLLLLVGASGFGLLSLGAIFHPVQQWLVDVGVLVPANQALITLNGEAGLDVWRVVTVIGILLGGIACVCFLLARRQKRV